jgi:hypothetical protein
MKPLDSARPRRRRARGAPCSTCRRQRDGHQGRAEAGRFGTRAVSDPPTDYYDGVKITNASASALHVTVAAGLPDDFGFGLMPGSTCPVFETDAPMGSGTSCRAWFASLRPRCSPAGSRPAP